MQQLGRFPVLVRPACSFILFLKPPIWLPQWCLFDIFLRIETSQAFLWRPSVDSSSVSQESINCTMVPVYVCALCVCIIECVCMSEWYRKTGREIAKEIKGTRDGEELFNGDLAIYPTSSALDWWFICLDGHVFRCVFVCCSHDWQMARSQLKEIDKA